MKSDETSKRPQATSRYPIAALYQRSVLDPLIEVARSISHDFVKRPRHYRAITNKVADILQDFRIRTGSTPEWLSGIQRARVYNAMFGASFCSGSVGLRTASAVFRERGPEGKDLLEVVRDAALTFRGYLRTIEGTALSGADSETGPVFSSAIEVLRNESVARVFGLPAPPRGNWPLDGTLKADNDSVDGAYLIEEIQRTLNISSIRPPLTEHRFMLMQKVAHYGSKTIVGVSDEAAGWDSANRLQALASNAYAWEKALQGLLVDIDVIRAWKDPQYRENLSPCEKGIVPPHPSGEVDLKDIQLDASSARAVLGFSTWTFLAICCCTGALPCTAGTNTDYKCCRTSDIECGILT